MPTTTWKSLERYFAKLFEGLRVPSSGNGGIKGDIIQMRLLPGLIGESKHGAQVSKAGPAALNAWLAEAERDARTAGADGAVLFMHPDGASRADSLVLVRAGVLARALRNLRAKAAEARAPEQNDDTDPDTKEA